MNQPYMQKLIGKTFDEAMDIIATEEICFNGDKTKFWSAILLLIIIIGWRVAGLEVQLVDGYEARLINFNPDEPSTCPQLSDPVKAFRYLEVETEDGKIVKILGASWKVAHEIDFLKQLNSLSILSGKYNWLSLNYSILSY